MKNLFKHIKDVEGFKSEIINIAKKGQFPASFLLKVMFFESGMNPNSENKLSGAYGLIQFMPGTLARLGLTKDDIQDEKTQLEAVQAYFKDYSHRIATFEDCYLAVFFPAAIGKPDDFVIETKKLTASKIASQNKAFDTNKDGKITKKEIKGFLASWFLNNAIGYEFNMK